MEVIGLSPAAAEDLGLKSEGAVLEWLRCVAGDGGGGIRTHGALAHPSVFKTDPFGRSGTPPGRIVTERTVRGLSERARRTCQTLTVTTVDAIELPARSAATAVRACCPRVAFRVFQFARYGAEVAVPISAPSTKNLTVATPDCESLADALIRKVPLTVAPAAGDAMATEGGVVSAGDDCVT